VIEGLFKKGELIKADELHYPNGVIYSGGIRKGKFHGKGTLKIKFKERQT